MSYDFADSNHDAEIIAELRQQVADLEKKLRAGPAAAAGSAVAMREALLSAQAALSDGAFTGPMVDASLKQIEAALAAPQAQEARDAVIEQCATIADRAAGRCVREQIPGDSVARFVAQQIRATSSISRPMRGQPSD